MGLVTTATVRMARLKPAGPIKLVEAHATPTFLDTLFRVRDVGNLVAGAGFEPATCGI